MRNSAARAGAGLVLLSLLLAGCSESTGGPGGAELACKEKVRAQLSQGASFTNVRSFQSNDGSWSVAGEADGFSFTCSLEYVEGERYAGDATIY